MKRGVGILSQIVENTPVPTFVIDADHRIIHWNSACEQVTGVLSTEMVGTTKAWHPFYPHERPTMANLVLDGRIEEVKSYYKGKYYRSKTLKDVWEAEDFFPHFPEGGKWLSFSAVVLKDEFGNIIGAIETLRDVTKQKEYQAKLEFQANHDALTGLANRNLLSDRLNQAISHAQRDQRLLSLLFIDLDNFKTVNDTLGHNVGDRLIVETAKKISTAVRSGDTVARLGGDEFVVLLFAPENEDHVIDIVQRITQEVATSFSHEGEKIYVGCSIGIAMYPQDGSNVETLMMNADSAMYLAKTNDKGGFRFFTQDLNVRARTRLQIENDLHRAIADNQFELVYQPILNLATEEIVAAEALLRWNHPQRGVISPDDFIHIAEETGLIVPIGQWVLETAAQEALYWQDTLGKPLRISINVSARQFRNREIHAALQRVYDCLGHLEFNIELELTENLVMHDPQKAEKHMEELRAMGVDLAMDDFGTGYSSLAYLRHFPFDMIKIDKAFVDDLGQSREAEAIVKAMLELGRALGLRMLAEGVETELQRSFLMEEGCDEVQGFLFSRPVNVESFRKLLLKEKVSATAAYIAADI